MTRTDIESSFHMSHMHTELMTKVAQTLRLTTQTVKAKRLTAGNLIKMKHKGHYVSVTQHTLTMKGAQVHVKELQALR